MQQLEGFGSGNASNGFVRRADGGLSHLPNPKSPKYSFKKAWSWPHEIEAKIKELCEGYTLHVCCGDSRLGDVRVDLYKNADIRADMFHLPIRKESFDTVVCDPYWQLPYHVRHLLLYNLRDSLKIGGRLIFNCFWFPKVLGLKVDEELYVGVPHSTWRNASLLITARRVRLNYGNLKQIMRGIPR